ncbi:alpha/beta hydrolase [Variovorax sp. J22R133]|uniref:alpha/beta fold hydrolase n=1 Tax=Variovorax brevis TaxID=3053503 RepID=UPI002575194E|nr:alpha/beta hydrolase [Variovorax sp. J22R133]MDM0112649.1 alpha/beta hydrolase [Variovorax sp. J22R133]
MTPFYREQGNGTGVVCLHSNASTSAQWRALSDVLADRYRVIAVDGYGAGKSPAWPTGVKVHLEHEVKLLEEVLERAGDRFHLVGHSYGAAVALKLATMHPGRLRSIVVYEPTLFYLVANGDALSSPAEGIWRAATDAADAIDRGDSFAAAERFIDFWMGEGAWASMPPARQTVVAGSMQNVRGWRDALMAPSAPLAAFAALDVPVLYMWGDKSPESSLSVARLLTKTLKRVTLAPQSGMGHMGPITHPDRVNPQIAAFLDAH